jgi:hypothetical protein
MDDVRHVNDPETGGESPDFGLDDWPPPGRRGRGSRQVRMHSVYLGHARRMGVPTGYIFNADEIAARDGWACAVCGEPVPQRWTAAQLGQAPALTFAVAWADGGRYDQANARLAHFGCAMFPDAGLQSRLGAVLVRDLAVKAHAAPGDQACGNGHELSGANLLKSRDGRRRCRQCRNDRERGLVVQRVGKGTFVAGA